MLDHNKIVNKNFKKINTYYLQISNNFKYNGNIYMHMYVRNRGKDINGVYKCPKLSNWFFIE